jgi:hypothetical protein
MPTETPYPCMIKRQHTEIGKGKPGIEQVKIPDTNKPAITEPINLRDKKDAFTKTLQAFAKYNLPSGEYLIQSSFRLFNPFGKGNHIIISQEQIDYYKRQET